MCSPYFHTLTFSKLSDLFDHFSLNVQCTTAAATVAAAARAERSLWLSKGRQG